MADSAPTELEPASRSQHVIALALAAAAPSLPALAAAASVSHLWSGASADALASVHALDLSSYAAILDDAVLGKLVAKLPALQVLSLSGCALVTDCGLAHLTSCCPQLQSLNLACIPRVTADGVGAVVGNLPITELELAGCAAITEAQLIARFARFLEVRTSASKQAPTAARTRVLMDCSTRCVSQLDEDEDGLAKVQG